MNEHGWPGWPDDPTGGDAHDGGLHAAHPGDDHSGLHDGAGTPDHGWPADDAWDNESPPGGDIDDGGDIHDRADEHDPADAGYDIQDHDIPDHRSAGYDDGLHDTAEAPPTDPAMGPVGTDPDALAEPEGTDPDAAGAFPPAVDVGALPEPVDGFPWIDTGSLGLLAAETAADEPVTAGQLSADLAAYAATDLPPGADPWAELAGSDDPATSTLARWWAPGH